MWKKVLGERYPAGGDRTGANWGAALHHLMTEYLGYQRARDVMWRYLRSAAARKHVLMGPQAFGLRWDQLITHVEKLPPGHITPTDAKKKDM